MSTFASQTLTASGVFTDTQTVTVGGKVYTTQTALTNADGNVLIGASAAATLQNLKDAINLTGTPGTQYAAAMTINQQVRATFNDATTLVVKARNVGGMGNNIATTETQTNAAWGAGTLAGATGVLADDIRALINGSQMNASVEQQLRDLIDPFGIE